MQQAIATPLEVGWQRFLGPPYWLCLSGQFSLLVLCLSSHHLLKLKLKLKLSLDITSSSSSSALFASPSQAQAQALSLHQLKLKLSLHHRFKVRLSLHQHFKLKLKHLSSLSSCITPCLTSKHFQSSFLLPLLQTSILWFTILLWTYIMNYNNLYFQLSSIQLQQLSINALFSCLWTAAWIFID